MKEITSNASGKLFVELALTDDVRVVPKLRECFAFLNVVGGAVGLSPATSIASLCSFTPLSVLARKSVVNPN